MIDWEETLPYITTLKDEGAILTFDGDSRTAIRLKRHRNRANGNTTWSEVNEYTLFSSVTGQKIRTLTDTGGKYQTFVYMGSSVIAEYTYGNNNNSEVVFKHSDPLTGSVMQTALSGELSLGGAGRQDIGALGTFIPLEEDEIVTDSCREK